MSISESLYLGGDLATRPRGVLATETRHKALLIPPLGPLRAMVVGADSPGVHFRLPLTV